MDTIHRGGGGGGGSEGVYRRGWSASSPVFNTLTLSKEVRGERSQVLLVI